MTFFLTTLPLWLSAVILIVPTTLLAMAGPVIVRRYVEVSQLRTNNEVAGFTFPTVGVLYAVLIAFAVVVVTFFSSAGFWSLALAAGAGTLVAAAVVFGLSARGGFENDRLIRLPSRLALFDLGAVRQRSLLEHVIDDIRAALAHHLTAVRPQPFFA